MKVNLKDNIWIEGLNNEIYFPHIFDVCSKDADNIVYKGKNIIYSGKTSEITEDTACDLVEADYERYGYVNYSVLDYEKDKIVFESAKESIQSACPEEYCVIYKTISQIDLTISPQIEQCLSKMDEAQNELQNDLMIPSKYLNNNNSTQTKIDL